MWIKVSAVAVVLLYITSSTDAAVAAIDENAEIERALGHQLLRDLLNYEMGNPSATPEYPLLAYLDKMRNENRNENREQVLHQSSYPASYTREEWGRLPILSTAEASV